MRQWPRVPAVGGDRGPAAQHTRSPRGRSLSLSPTPDTAPPHRRGPGPALQCSQDSRACARLETPRFGLRAPGGPGRVARRCGAEAGSPFAAARARWPAGAGSPRAGTRAAWRGRDLIPQRRGRGGRRAGLCSRCFTPPAAGRGGERGGAVRRAGNAFSRENFSPPSSMEGSVLTRTFRKLGKWSRHGAVRRGRGSGEPRPSRFASRPAETAGRPGALRLGEAGAAGRGGQAVLFPFTS